MVILPRLFVDRGFWRRAALETIPLAIYLGIGVAAAICWLSLSRGGSALSYFLPLRQIASAALAASADVPGALSAASTFSKLTILALFFVLPYQAGYISLGFEGSLMLGITGTAVAVYLLEGATGSWPAGIIGMTAISVCVFLIYRVLAQGYFDGNIDDVTPGVVLNLAAIAIVAVALRASGLSDGQAQSVASVEVLRPAIFAERATQAGVASLSIWCSIAVVLSATLLLGRTNLGLLLRATGSNRGAARAAGVDYRALANGIATISAVLIGLAGALQLLVHGKIQTEDARGIVVDVLTVSLLAQNKAYHVPIAVLAVMGLNHVKLQLQIAGLPPESVLIAQGALILIFSAFASRRTLHD